MGSLYDSPGSSLDVCRVYYPMVCGLEGVVGVGTGGALEPPAPPPPNTPTYKHAGVCVFPLSSIIAEDPSTP